MWAFLRLHPCVDCGEADPIVLDFDHIDRTTKVKNVSAMIYHAWSSIEREIAKCEVRCANCHRRKTHLDLGWHNGVF